MERPEIALSVVTGAFQTNYHDIGSGWPVVLLHGSGPGVSAWANWNKTFPLLGRYLRLLAPDLAGFGYTQRVPDATYSLSGWLKQVVDFLDALGVERAHFVGNSFGGALALAMATQHPERVDKMVLMGSMGVSFPITEGLEKVWGYEPSMANMAVLCNLFLHNQTLAPPDLIESRYQSSIQPGFQESFHAMFPEPRQDSVDALAIYEANLGDVKAPTLVIHGLQDNVIPVSNALRLLNRLPDAQLHVFGQCGHWTQIEHTDEFCALVRDFLV